MQKKQEQSHDRIKHTHGLYADSIVDKKGKCRETSFSLFFESIGFIKAIEEFWEKEQGNRAEKNESTAEQRKISQVFWGKIEHSLQMEGIKKEKKF